MKEEYTLLKPSKHTCVVCGANINELFELKLKTIRGTIRSSVSRWEINSLWFSCPNCKIFYNFPKTTNKKVLNSVCYEIQARRYVYIVKETFNHGTRGEKKFKKDTLVYRVPEYLNTTTSFRVDSVKDSSYYFTESPFRGSKKYKIPLKYLRKKKQTKTALN